MDYLQRLSKALGQSARNNNSAAILPAVIESLSAIIPLCGQSTNTRKAALRLGEVMLANNKLKVIAPCCPDWSHQDGAYTFRGLNSGISLMAWHQIRFLRSIQETLSIPLEVKIAYPDQEVDDKHLLEWSQGDEQLFQKKIDSSILTTRAEVQKDGWQVCAMSEFLPDFRRQEEKVKAELRQNEKVRARIISETMHRMELYKKIHRDITPDEAIERTIRGASHYIILGKYAVANKVAISNHTTTNLSWYNETGAGLLHNPVNVY